MFLHVECSRSAALADYIERNSRRPSPDETGPSLECRSREIASGEVQIDPPDTVTPICRRSVDSYAKHHGIMAGLGPSLWSTGSQSGLRL
nr:hypothetical protein CFP56_13091 [Quercus suber]